jgi:hypothetical protein
MAKRFFYVCAGLFLLALTYHLGARSAGAQAGGTIVGVANYGNSPMVVTSGGDVYTSNPGGTAWAYQSNVFGAGPTEGQPESWGAVKDKYRK